MSEATLLPLTPGLLASAMMRHDHAVFAPWFENDPIHALLGRPEERIPDAMQDVLRIYDALAAGQPADPQTSEEFLGSGFYAPERETNYAACLDAYGMRATAIALIMDRDHIAG